MTMLRYGTPILGLMFVLGAVLSASPAAQKAEINVATTTRVSLGKSAGQPNESALVPIYFVPPKSIPIGRVKFTVTYVSASAKFDKVLPSPFAEDAKVSFQSEVKPGKNEKGVETQTVTIQAEVPASAADGLPSGLLGYLSLKLSSEAKPAQITLRTSDAEASRMGSSDLLPDVRSFDAQLEVQATGYSPAVVCFFFSH